jgi:hypothetical protein
MRRSGFCTALLLAALAGNDRALALAVGDLSKPANQKKAGGDDVLELLKRIDRDNSEKRREFDAPRTQVIWIIGHGVWPMIRESPWFWPVVVATAILFALSFLVVVKTRAHCRGTSTEPKN